LKIAIVSKSNAQGGGASRFAEDLAAWLIDAGHNVDHFCAFLPERRRPFQKELYPAGFGGKLCRFVHRRARRAGLNEIVPVEYFVRLRHLLAAYDVVHFHDHYTAYSLVTAALVSKKTKVFFTAHDCLHFTGDVTYPPLFEPSAGSESMRARFSRSVNTRVAEGSSVKYIYPSRWLMNEAQKRLHFRNEPVVVPYGFDAGPYNYKTRSEARKQLGLPLERRITCISAHYLSDKRKGVEYALRAVVAAKDLNPFVMLVGNPANGVEDALSGIPFWFSGYVESRERLGLLYAAADIFLFCTLQDNLPISVQEAMAAATPVVGFATGGVPEMVKDGESAWLVPTGHQEALNKVNRESLTASAAEKRGFAARETVLTRFSTEQCVRSHIALYSGADSK
jgi:glycosyltransferase involved in cell wall biosynthesis